MRIIVIVGYWVAADSTFFCALIFLVILIFVFLIVSVFSYCSAEVLGAGLCQFGLFLGSFSLVNTYISCSMFWCWFLVFSTKFFNS